MIKEKILFNSNVSSIIVKILILKVLVKVWGWIENQFKYKIPFSTTNIKVII